MSSNEDATRSVTIMVRAERCETCTFYSALSVDESFAGMPHGECRRRAPCFRGSEASWPPIAFNSWCGEWLKNEGAPMAPYREVTI